MRGSLPERVASKPSTGVPKSVASKRRIRLGRSVPAKSTTIWSPTWCRLIGVCGSDSARRRVRRHRRCGGSRSSAARASSLAADRRRAAGRSLVATAPPAAPSMITMLLPSTRMAYGIILSRFSTRRVRSAVSAARIVSRPPARTSMRREGSASVVLGRSSEMRAGSSMVKPAAAAPVPTAAGSAAAAVRPSAARRWPAAGFIRGRAGAPGSMPSTPTSTSPKAVRGAGSTGDGVSFLRTPCRPYSFNASAAGRSM